MGSHTVPMGDPKGDPSLEAWISISRATPQAFLSKSKSERKSLSSLQSSPRKSHWNGLRQKNIRAS